MCHVLHWCQLRKPVSGAGKARRWMDLWAQNRKQLEVPLGGNIKLIHQQWHNSSSGTERGLCPPADGQTHLTSWESRVPRNCPKTVTVLTGELSSWSVAERCHMEICINCAPEWISSPERCLLVSPQWISKLCRILPGWCSVHLFTLWCEGPVWSSPHQDLSVRCTWVSLVSLVFPAVWQECAPICLFTVTHTGFCEVSSQSHSGTEFCGALLRTSPIAQYKMVSSFPRAFIFCSITPSTFPVLPWGPASSLAPTSCYSEISLFILDSVILLKHWYFPAISLLHGDAY